MIFTASNTSAIESLPKEKESYKYTLLLVLFVILGANNIYIDFFGFGANPSKFLVILILPLIGIQVFKYKFSPQDLLFLLFIWFVFVRSVFNFSLSYISTFSNALFPFLAYLFFKSKLNKVKIEWVLWGILIITLINCLIGISEFFSDTRLIPLSTVVHDQEFKLKYAQQYSFNPFANLLILPQGLFAFSTSLAVSIIMPTCILLAIRKRVNGILFWILFSSYAFTVFIAFSRFEILGMLLVILIHLFLVKDNTIKFGRFIIVAICFAIFLIVYLNTTEDTTGTLDARRVDADVISTLFDSPKKWLIGGDLASLEDSAYGDLPHNIFIFSIYNYGVLAGMCLISFFAFSVFRWYRFFQEHIKQSDYKYATLFIYLLLFYFYNLFIRGFDTYVLSGYEEYLIVFTTHILLEKLIQDRMRYTSEALVI